MAESVNLTVTQEDETVNLAITHDSDTVNLTIAQVGIKGDPGNDGGGAVDSVNGETGVVVLNEENISGTRVTASVTGTYSIDWEAGSVFILTMTGNTTFSDTNLPTGTATKVISIELTGDYVATLPSYWEARPSNDTYDGTVRNEITVNCKNGTTSSENVTYSLENLAT